MLRRLGWLAEAAEGSLIDASGDTPETQVDVALATTDSRECVSGSIYFARRGENSDGHSFASQAVAAGAACLIVERPLELDVPQVLVKDSTIALGRLARAHLADLRQQDGIKVVGITGSAGKTTTKDLLAQILSESGPTVAPINSLNNEVGCPLTILKADPKTRFLVLEMGASGRGHIAYLTQIAPLDVAVELLVGTAHLGGFGSVANLAASKQELVEGLVPGGTAILNKDDAHVRVMSEAAPAEVYYFSAKGLEDAQFRATHVALEDDGCPSFVLETPDFNGRIKLELAGVHQVGNALAAVACNFALGQSTIKAVGVLEKAEAVSPHRMAFHKNVEVSTDQGLVTVSVLDDSYNANPDSMRASIAAGEAMRGSGRLVFVLGQMLELGDKSDELHRDVSYSLAAVDPDLVIVVGADAKPLLEHLPKATITALASDYSVALPVLLDKLENGDLVVLKGSLGSEVWRIADSILHTA